MAETLTIEDFLYDRLSTDVTLAGLVAGVYVGLAPPVAGDAAVIVIQNQSARDIRGVGIERVMVDALYVVKAIKPGRSFVPLLPIADRIDVLLTGASGVASIGGAVLHAVREEPFEMIEVSAGVEFRHLGGLFRLWAQ